MKIFIGILLCLPLCFWGGVRLYKNIDYGIECGGHLKRAADANTIDLAKKELVTALTYMKSKNMTNGYTSVLYNTPNEDVEFWYQNIASSLTELIEVKDQSSKLEKTNILMKLCETLLDQGEKGPSITQPSGISIFPNNIVYATWGWIGIILFIMGCILIII